MEDLELLYVAYFATFVIVSETTLPLVTETINRLFTLTNKYVKSVVSWVVPLAIMYFGWGVGHIFEGSFLVGVAWYYPAIFGVLAGSISNFAWTSIPWIKAAISWLLDYLTSKLTNK